VELNNVSTDKNIRVVGWYPFKTFKSSSVVGPVADICGYCVQRRLRALIVVIEPPAAVVMGFGCRRSTRWPGAGPASESLQ
jgi:hypothetical protein